MEMRRTERRVLASLLVLTMSGCTFGLPLTTAAAVGTHNGLVDTDHEWSYAAPLVVSAVLGLAVDVAFLLLLNKQWSKPMT